jgi:hypothetical protein
MTDPQAHREQAEQAAENRREALKIIRECRSAHPGDDLRYPECRAFLRDAIAAALAEAEARGRREALRELDELRAAGWLTTIFSYDGDDGSPQWKCGFIPPKDSAARPVEVFGETAGDAIALALRARAEGEGDA